MYQIEFEYYTKGRKQYFRYTTLDPMTGEEYYNSQQSFIESFYQRTIIIKGLKP